jgi:formylglycine-generating enzyme required for sulfatase activity
MVQVFVEAGEFLMGSHETDSRAADDEKPQHVVNLDAFWIDMTEVTNAQYRRCVEAGVCTSPGCWGDADLSGDDQPVVCVTWYDAEVYAAWVGGRLPTEAEWEKAARGTDGRLYPWGNESPDCTKAFYSGCGVRTTDVGSHLEGASPYGALDMAGSVREWVADWYDHEYYQDSPGNNPLGPNAASFRVMRDGSNPAFLRCAEREADYPDARDYFVGFRVVMPAEPGDP